MANSQPPNQPRCNLVAPISVTSYNSPRQRVQGAMEMNLKSRPDITCRALLRVPLSAPVPHSSSPRSGCFPGHASLAHGRGVPGALTAPDLSRRPCSVRLPGSRSPRRPLRSPSRPIGSHRPGRDLEPYGPSSRSSPSSQLPACSPGTHQWDSGEVGGC